MGETIPETIDVPPWMLREGQVVADVASQTQGSAISVDQAGAKLANVMADSAGLLGWKSPGAQEARQPLEHANGQVGALRDAIDREASAWHALAAELKNRGPDLRRLVRERGQIIGRAHTAEKGDFQRVLDIDKQIRTHTGALALADRTARDALLAIAGSYRSLTALNLEDEWVGSAAPPEVSAVLGKYGITESDAERALLDKLMLLPEGPAGDAELRALLATMSPADVADFLLRHPDAARRLGGKLGPSTGYPPGSPEQRLADALERAKQLPPKEGVALVRAAFEGMDPDEQQRLALLYPEVVGNLNGAPLDLRMAANRVKIGVALDDERILGRPDPVGPNKQPRGDYYQKLLYEELENPTYVEGNGQPEQLGHQILYFDNAGDGTMAEMWGVLDKNARNVAVFVPGTSSDMTAFGNDSNKMRRLAIDDPANSTVTITWMGTDMPDEITPNAMSTSYAEEGGPKLRDFMWGLDVPSDRRVTVMGHSYGGAVVGTAERVGMDGVDQVLHLASAGAGNGVNSSADYPSGSGVKRYSMTAPGDSIGWSQGVWGGSVGHGADPNTFDDVTRLDTGRYAPDADGTPGAVMEGEGVHSGITKPNGSDAWKNILGVVTGGQVTLYAEGDAVGPTVEVDKVPSFGPGPARPEPNPQPGPGVPQPGAGGPPKIGPAPD